MATTGKMDEDKEGGAQAGPKGSSSGLNISLHPLVIINISDHATRKRSLSGGRPQRVLGVLLGVQVCLFIVPEFHIHFSWQVNAV